VPAWWHVLIARIRGWVGRESADADFNHELDAHLAQLAEDYARQGLAPGEASRAARLRLGGLTQLRETNRETRGLPWLDALWQDTRYAARLLRKIPGFTAGAILTIALGIGANAGLFSLLNGFFRPLPVPNPNDVVVLASDERKDEAGFHYTGSFQNIVALRRLTDIFTDVSGYNAWFGGLTINGTVKQLCYGTVAGNYFTTLGVTPEIGRLLVPGEGEHPTAELPIVLGYSFWQKHFAGDRGVVGQTVRFNDRAATIIGVTPKDFLGMYTGLEMDGYMPLNSVTFDWPREVDVFTDRRAKMLILFGRLKPGVTVAQAQQASSGVMRQLEQEYPATDEGYDIRVIPEKLARPIPLRVIPRLLPFISGFVLLLAGVVLLLACMNVANMQLARTIAREREMAVRAALGAGRKRLIQQMLTESVLLSVAGMLMGLLFARLATGVLLGMINVGNELPFSLDAGFDWRVFSYALAAAAATTILVGVWPALRASRANPREALHDGGRGESAGAGKLRVRRFLVVTQVAGSLVLLTVAGVFVRSLIQAQHFNLGFDSSHLLSARIDPRQVGYDRARTTSFFDDLERRVQEWPEVENATVGTTLPMSYLQAAIEIFLVDEAGRFDVKEPPVAAFNRVTPTYLDTLSIPILRGRGFEKSDDAHAPRVAIVNQVMAKKFWPDQNPIGKRFRYDTADSPTTEVIGVARDSKYLAIFEEPFPFFYVPIAQQFGSMRVVLLRTKGDPRALRTRLEREIHALEPALPIADLQTMTEGLNGGTGYLMFRTGAVQASAIGLLGLLLSVIGIYGVISYAVSQRTREIGIRVALGADPRQILRLILRQGVTLVVAGVAAGFLIAAVVSRLVGRLFALVGSGDLLTYGSVTLLLVGVALGACYLPARRATRIDPVTALRSE
jgi:putative ABC transport system permease protein